MTFAEPSWLAFLCLAAIPWLGRRSRPRVAWPTFRQFDARPWRWPRWVAALTRSIEGLVIATLVIALARPQVEGGQVRVAGQGLGIVVLLDRSSSMNREDFRPAGPTAEPAKPASRWESAKATVSGFLLGRPDDLIGLATFANYPDTVAPLNLDRRSTWMALQPISTARASDDGTDLGGAIAWGTDLLRGSPTRRKVLVLLTDGHDAPGSARSVGPARAAEIARDLGINLYTIAVGSPSPPGPDGAAGDPGPDLALLTRLAEVGNGRAFSAADESGLRRVFDSLDRIERSPVAGTVRVLYIERRSAFLLAAVGLMFAAIALEASRLRLALSSVR